MCPGGAQLGIDDGGRRRGRLLSAAAGPVALVAVAVGAVAACGGSSPGAPDASATASRTGTSAGSEASPAPSDEAAEASPSAGADRHVTGQVKHGVHSGDLRFFLVPAPAEADVSGEPAGSPLSADDIAAQSPDQAAAKRSLTAYGFRAGAYRTYLTADGVSEVTVRLVRFAGPDQAAGYYSAQSYQGATIALDGSFPARAYNMASGSAESTDTLLATSYQGDVHITITVTGGRTPSSALLEHLLDAQYQRLSTGR